MRRSRGEKSSWQAAAALTSAVWRALIYSSFQLWKNMHYITADLQCIPGPLKFLRKYVCSRCGEAVKLSFGWKLENAQIS